MTGEAYHQSDPKYWRRVKLRLSENLVLKLTRFCGAVRLECKDELGCSKRELDRAIPEIVPSEEETVTKQDET